MSDLKQIMYGVTDFARMRRENAGIAIVFHGGDVALCEEIGNSI